MSYILKMRSVDEKLAILGEFLKNEPKMSLSFLEELKENHLKAGDSERRAIETEIIHACIMCRVLTVRDIQGHFKMPGKRQVQDLFELIDMIDEEAEFHLRMHWGQL